MWLCVHAVLSGNGLNELEKSRDIKEVYFTNTIDNSSRKFSDKIKVISVADVFAKAIINFHKNKSIDSLFDQNPK